MWHVSIWNIIQVLVSSSWFVAHKDGSVLNASFFSYKMSLMEVYLQVFCKFLILFGILYKKENIQWCIISHLSGMNYTAPMPFHVKVKYLIAFGSYWPAVGALFRPRNVFCEDVLPEVGGCVARGLSEVQWMKQCTQGMQIV